MAFTNQGSKWDIQNSYKDWAGQNDCLCKHARFPSEFLLSIIVKQRITFSTWEVDKIPGQLEMQSQMSFIVGFW